MPLSYSINIFQLRENVGETDLEKDPGTEELTYTTGGGSNDFQPISVGGIKESLEIDRGVFEIDSVSMVLDGIAETYFNAYDDPLNAPFVVVISDDTEVLFHGVVARESVNYNAATGYTTLEVLSWLYVLEQTAAAPRSVYETVSTKPYLKEFNQFPSIGLPLTIDGTDLDDVVVAGDVLVFETTYGEWRATVLGKQEQSDHLQVFLLGEPETVLIADYAVPNTAVQIKFIQTSATSTVRTAKVKISDADLWAGLSELVASYEGNAQVINNSFINVAIELGTGAQYALKLYAEGASTSNALGQEVPQIFLYGLDDNETDVYFLFPISEAEAANAVLSGLDILNVTVNTSVKKGTKVRVLGKDIYGYSPAFFYDTYLKTEIVEGLFGLADTGIFRYVADTFNYPSGFSGETITRIFEYPNNLLESLRLIQNTEYAYMRLTPTLDGSNLPRLTVEMIRRTEANTATQTSTGITEIESYQEQAASMKPRGVMVEPHILYNLPNGEKRFETRGFWFDGVTTADPATTVPPTGADVLKIKVNKEPAYAGSIWVSNEKGVRQDSVLKQSARRFFEFYAGLSRKASITVDNVVSRDVLGNFVTINEGGLTRTIFVTSWERDLVREQTRLEGLVGTYTETVSETPIARISGATTYTDTDDGGTEDITLSGELSYSPQGLPLTYSWELDPDGTPSTIGSSAILSAETLAVGTHVIELTVSDGTNTDTARATIRILPPDGQPSGAEDIEADFTQGPQIDATAGGDVYLTVAGDTFTTQTTDGIKVEVSTSNDPFSWSAVADSPYDNPIENALIYEDLGVGATLWVRVTLVNEFDGSDSAVGVAVLQVTNHQNTVPNPVTTKGDLIMGDAAGNQERFAACPDGQIIEADAAEALGWKCVDKPTTSTTGFTGSVYGVTDVDGNPKIAVFVDGLMTALNDPGASVATIFYITDPAGNDGSFRKLTI